MFNAFSLGTSNKMKIVKRKKKKNDKDDFVMLDVSELFSLDCISELFSLDCIYICNNQTNNPK